MNKYIFSNSLLPSRHLLKLISWILTNDQKKRLPSPPMSSRMPRLLFFLKPWSQRHLGMCLESLVNWRCTEVGQSKCVSPTIFYQMYCPQHGLSSSKSLNAFQVTASTQPSFLQQVVCLDQAEQQLVVLGEVNKQYVVSPNVEALLSAIDKVGSLQDENLIKTKQTTTTGTT